MIAVARPAGQGAIGQVVDSTESGGNEVIRLPLTLRATEWSAAISAFRIEVYPKLVELFVVQLRTDDRT